MRGKLPVHGHAGTVKSKTYSAWSAMRVRCRNPRSQQWRNYGARGIRVCERWQHSFENFLADMGECPPGLFLERIDNNGNYEPGNVKWGTRAEQDSNKRTNRKLTLNGLTLCVTEWSKRSGVAPITIFARLKRGWPAHPAVFEPPNKGRKMEIRQKQVSKKVKRAARKRRGRPTSYAFADNRHQRKVGTLIFATPSGGCFK